MTPRTAQPAAVGRAPALPGRPFPLGATVRDGGTNFAVASATADGMLLCLFDERGAETQIPLLDCDAGVWHGFVPGVGAGQAYGYRADGSVTIRAGACAATRPSCCSTRTPGPSAGRSASGPRCSATPPTTRTRRARWTRPGTCRAAWWST